MANYNNAVRKISNIETLKALNPETLATASGSISGSSYFDTSTGDLWNVPNGTEAALSINDTSWIYINNQNSNTYIDIYLFGNRAAYATLGSKKTDFYIVVCGDADNENGLGGIWVYTSEYGMSLRKNNNSDINRAIYPYLQPVPAYSSNGGGATHIAKVTGQLKDLSSNLSDILMVSGGGGGGYLVGENAYAGADAGGISGSNYKSGTQSTGYAFGQGEST